MVKKLFTLALVLIAAIGFAQSTTIKGAVKDMATHEALSHVTISADNGRWVTISNDEGSFALACPADVKKISFSILGYAPHSVNTAQLPNDGVYYLESKDFEIDEVVVLNYPVNELVDNLVKTSVAKLQAPLVINTYYREFVNINGKDTKFADGIVEYNLYRKKDNIKSGIVVKENRAASLEVVEEGAVRGLGPSVVDAAVIESNFRVLTQILHKKSVYKKYDYDIKPIKNDSGEKLCQLVFKPKQGIKEALYNVTIVYNPESNIIMNLEAQMAPDLLQYTKAFNILLARYSYNDFVYKSSFKIVDGKYMPSTSYLYGILRIWNKKYDNSYRFKSDYVVTGFSTNEADFTKKDNYDERSLYERGNNFSSDFWTKNNSIVLTKEEEQIIESLNKQQKTIQTQTN